MATIRFGTSGNDTMFGNDLDDYFFAGSGDDTMFGGRGNDIFYASAGSDFMFGESGTDTVNYSQISSAASFNSIAMGVYVSLQDGEGFEFGGIGTDHYSSIENVTGSNFLDAIQGDGNANVIRGLGGDDIIEGMGGADTLEGGEGIDYLTYRDSTARVSVDLLNNTASGGHATGDVISGFESLEGSRFGDSLSGTNGVNEIDGGDGADTINARGGNDTIEGGEGNDTMTGGSGADTFVFWIEQQHTGTDHITDFDVDRDTLLIDHQDGNESTIRMAVGNYNPYSMTFDVILSMSDNGGDAGTIILDDISVADIGEVMGRIELV
jgi:Ca2+-binding RTX toxin-like protein